MATIINGDTGVSQVQQTISAAISLIATQSGAKFYVAAATVAYNITLPTASAGLNFEFEGINGAYAVGLTYAGTLYLPDGTTAAAGIFSQISLSPIGNTIKVWSDGGSWFMTTLGQEIVKNGVLNNQAVNFSQVIGIGQTWQNVTASRAVNTSYTNSTGKPITASISTSESRDTNSTGASISVNGVVIASSQAYRASASAGGEAFATVVVPSGATFSYSWESGYDVVSRIMELR